MEKKDYSGLGKSNVVHIGQGKDTLSKLPAPPSYLSASAAKHYKKMGESLIKADRLKETFLPGLEIFAVNMAQFEHANKEIERKNKKAMGAGYIQTFKNGTANISPEVTLRNAAEKTLFQCLKQFGLDPRSEKDLRQPAENPYGDLFSAFQEKFSSVK
jgi:P27 family predicted phage terminase small subunit